MVRTRADAGGTKVAGAKAPRKVFSANPAAGPSMAGSPSGKGAKYSGGNCYNPQPTPDWQKGINSFFKQQSQPEEGESNSGDGNAGDTGGGSCGSGRDSGQNSGRDSGQNSGRDSGQNSGRSSPQTEPMEQEGENSGKQFEKNGMISDDDE